MVLLLNRKILTQAVRVSAEFETFKLSRNVTIDLGYERFLWIVILGTC